jgi:hypothetical protein
MSCQNNANRTTGAAIRCGISRIASKAAYVSIGIVQNPDLVMSAVVAATSVWVVASSLLAQRRRRRAARRYFYMGFSRYDKEEFDRKASTPLSEKFDGAELELKSLREITGRGSRPQPLVRTEEKEADIFLMDGPNGHVHYTMPNDGTAKIIAVVPRKNRGDELAKALNAGVPKYIVVGKMTNDEYETRDPEVARQFSRALGGKDADGGQVWPENPEFEKQRKPIPAAMTV